MNKQKKNFLVKLFFSCLRGLKMQHQVVVIVIIILILAMLLVALSYSLYSQIIITLIQESSKLILVKQDRNAIASASIHLQQYINEKQDFYVLRISHLNYLYQYFIENKARYKIQKNQLQPCLTEDEQQSNFIQYTAPLFCFQACGVPDRVTIPVSDASIDIFNGTIQLIDQFIIGLDAKQNTLIAVAGFTDSMLYSGYPNMSLIPSYNPQKRPWYQYNQAQQLLHPDSQYFFSPVFLSFKDNDFVMTLTSTIRDLTNQSIGILEQVILVQDTSISNVHYNILLVNQEGQVILAGMEGLGQLNSTLYIYDSNITGFNQSDWLLIQKMSTNNDDHPVCDGRKEIFCLFNSQFNQSVRINATQFKEYNFTLIMQYTNLSSFSNVTFTEALDKQFNLISSQLKDWIGLNQMIQLVGGAVLLTFASFFIYYIFIPLKQLMQALSFAIKSAGNNLNVQIFKMLNKRQDTNSRQRSNNFSTLRQCFFRFEDHLNQGLKKKNLICMFIESLQYPKKDNDAPELIIQFEKLGQVNAANQSLMIKIKKIIQLGLNGSKQD